MEIKELGMPRMNSFVPSIGSTTQNRRTGARGISRFLREPPVVGEGPKKDALEVLSAARSASVTGWSLALLPDVRKRWR